MEDVAPPFFVNGRGELAPTFQWGTRIGTPPPNLAYPAFLNTNPTQDVSVSLTKVAGRHTMKVGFYSNHSLKQQNLNQRNALPFQGDLSFANDTNNPLDTGFGFANAALGVFTAYTQQSSFVEGKFVYNQIEAYAQDNWKVNSKLTLDYGLRFTHQAAAVRRQRPGLELLPRPLRPRGGAGAVSAGLSGRRVPVRDHAPGDEPADRRAHGRGHGGADRPDRARHAATPPTASSAPATASRSTTTSGRRWRSRRGSARPTTSPAGRRSWSGAASACSSIGRTATPSITSRRTRRPRPTRPSATACCRRWAPARCAASSGVPTLINYRYDNPEPALVAAVERRHADDAAVVVLARRGVCRAALLPRAERVPVADRGEHQRHRLRRGVPAAEPGSDAQRRRRGVAGSGAYVQELLRPIRGYANIDQQWQEFERTYHSMQFSATRRFRNGVSFGGNYTLSLSDNGTTGVPLRLQHDADGSFFDPRGSGDLQRADEEPGPAAPHRQGELHLGPAGLAHGGARRIVAAVVNDWQLSGIFTGGSGATYDITYQYQNNGANVNLTGSPDYAARER